MRKSRGFGTFITREQIEKKNPRVTTDLFRSVSGVKLMRENGSPTVVSARLGNLSYCPVRYYVDGTSYPLYGQSIDAWYRSWTLARSKCTPAARPCRHSSAGARAACGVIAIWTRQGDEEGEAVVFPAPGLSRDAWRDGSILIEASHGRFR